MSANHKLWALSAFLLAVGLPIPSGTEAQLPSENPGQAIAEGAEALAAGDLERAAASFRRALESAPDSEPALLGLSEALALQGDPVAALALARQALAADPDSVPATLAVSRHLAQLGDSEQALGTLDRLRALDPQEIQGYRLSALLLRNLGKTEEAIELLEMALEQGLRNPYLEEELALLLLAANRPEEAELRARAALDTLGETAGNQLALGLAIAASTSADRSLAVPRLERAIELGILNPGRVHLELGSLLLEVDRPDEAIDHLEQAAELMPNSSEVFYKLGNAQRMTGDAEGASKSITRFQELKTQTEQQERLELEVGTALNEAQELAQSDRLTEALGLLDRMLTNHPDQTRVHILRAKILYSMRRLDAALTAIRRARELDPTLVEPHFLEGMFLLQMNNPGGARIALERATNLEPTLGEAQELLGGAYAKLDQPAAAARCFERALDLGAESPALRLGYAAVLESLGRLEEAAQQDEAYRSLVQPPQ